MSTDDELFELQRTLYTSKNPTRRWLHTSRRDWIVAAIRAVSGEGVSRAVEVGPGSGIYLPTLAAVAEDVIALDIENAYLERILPIAEEHPNVRLVRDDITRSKLDTASVDLALCTEVIEHIPRSFEALTEIHRILRPTGVLILSTPQRFSPLELSGKIAFLPGVVELIRLVYQEPVIETGHTNLMTRRALRSQLTRAGFDVCARHASGVYLPVIAEVFGDRALKAEQALDRRLRGSILEWLLWTQYVVARPR